MGNLAMYLAIRHVKNFDSDEPQPVKAKPGPKDKIPLELKEAYFALRDEGKGDIEALGLLAKLSKWKKVLTRSIKPQLKSRYSDRNAKLDLERIQLEQSALTNEMAHMLERRLMMNDGDESLDSYLSHMSVDPSGTN